MPGDLKLLDKDGVQMTNHSFVYFHKISVMLLELRIYLKSLGLRIKSILASFLERQFLPTSKSRVSDERLNLMANDRDNGE